VLLTACAEGPQGPDGWKPSRWDPAYERFTCDDGGSGLDRSGPCGGVGFAGPDTAYVTWNWNFPEPGLWPTELRGVPEQQSDSTVVLYVQVDSIGAGFLPNRTVTLTATAIDEAGAAADGAYGHFHRGLNGLPKPAGVFLPANASQVVVNTGDSVGLVTYRTSAVSGPVILRGESEGAKPAVDTIPVGVFGLVELVPGPTFDTVGPTTIHPSSNWVTPVMGARLMELADSFFAKYGTKLGYNDASLPRGGKFDLHEQWGADDPTCRFRNRSGVLIAAPRGCHGLHRLGLDVDLRVLNLSSQQRNRVRDLWSVLAEEQVINEGDHYHLRYRP